MKNIFVSILTILSFTASAEIPDSVLVFYMKRHEYATILENKLLSEKEKVSQLDSLLSIEQHDRRQFETDASNYHKVIEISGQQLMIAQKEFAAVRKKLRRAHALEITLGVAVVVALLL